MPKYLSVNPFEEVSVKTENEQRPNTPRYIRKEGTCRVLFRHVPEEWMLFVTDIFTTLVEIRWRVMFLIFALSYILSWLFFGILFFIIALVHGDVRDHNNDPCVFEVRSFTASFLFSLETQTTIGYGFRGMSENCMIAIIIVTIQDVISCFIDTFVIGIVVAKMASARKRAQTVGFSNRAVINLRDGFLCLSWRIGDFRRHHMVEGSACAQILRTTVHTTGKVDVTYEDLSLQQKDIILITPTTVYHRIESGSPLYKMSLEDLRKADFELLVSFTYTDDSTGMLHQTRTSYTTDEILWGHLFQEMIRVTNKHYKVDYNLFNNTAKVLVPLNSAEEYEKRKIEKEEQKQLRLLARASPRHSPRGSPRPSSRSPQQSHPENRLNPPIVLVELMGDNQQEPNVPTTEGGNQHTETLTVPKDSTIAE
ncbi:PREDICTED: inward rectifier potassium channel 16-like [Cyprinodon variegatus]|uniref:Potassium inwardly rectifying channel subfamily J member 16a n=1 Tax=Cyprinodon variegatus TaxID=28743 RepID=A0A3Q2D6A6_CYPVA|nr:PREDICTED: inward rectifier potassium channel 16-like [Cyprinodon variegatus]